MGIGSRMVGRGDNWWSGACDSDKYLEKKRGAKHCGASFATFEPANEANSS